MTTQAFTLDGAATLVWPIASARALEAYGLPLLLGVEPGAPPVQWFGLPQSPALGAGAPAQGAAVERGAPAAPATPVPAPPPRPAVVIPPLTFELRQRWIARIEAILDAHDPDGRLFTGGRPDHSTLADALGWSLGEGCANDEGLVLDELEALVREPDDESVEEAREALASAAEEIRTALIALARRSEAAAAMRRSA